MLPLILLACSPSSKIPIEDDTLSGLDTIDTVDTADTEETSDGSPSGIDTADSGDSGGPVDIGDTGNPSTATALSLIQERQVGGTSIWAYPIFSGDDIWLSTMQNGQVSLVPIDFGLEFIGDPVQISNQQDMRPNITVADHAFTELNGSFYFAVSGAGDEDLILIKTDSEGQRLGAFVLQNSFDVPTNDPHIVTTADKICVRWGMAGPQKKVQCFSEELIPESNEPLIIPSPVNTPQLGMTVWQDQEYLSFTGNENQRSLVYHRFTADWTPIEPDFEVVILPSENDEWNWFSSGVVYHETRDVWLVAYTHMASTGNADTDATVRIALFDGLFNLLQLEEISGPGFTRPHMALQGDDVLIAYDSANEVWMEHWQLVDD